MMEYQVLEAVNAKTLTLLVLSVFPRLLMTSGKQQTPVVGDTALDWFKSHLYQDDGNISASSLGVSSPM